MIAALEMQSFGEEYSTKVVANARYLAECLCECGFEVTRFGSAFTDTHQVWITGIESQAEVFAKKLAAIGLNVNCMPIPPTLELGIRLGASEITRFGYEESAIELVSKIVHDAFREICDLSLLSLQVSSLVQEKSVLCYSFDELRVYPAEPPFNLGCL